jgi:hypothetical protein
MSDKEIRSVEGAKVEARDNDIAGTLTGHAAMYGRETTIAGLFREVVQRGAFTAAVGRDDVRALFNHDPNFVLGRTKAGTLTLTEDEIGLRYDITLPNTLRAKELHESIKRGDISQSSFAFRVVKDSWPSVRSGEMPLRQIEEVELFDVSPVTYPAYEDTSVSARAKAHAEATNGRDGNNDITLEDVKEVCARAAAAADADKRLMDLRRRELELKSIA